MNPTSLLTGSEQKIDKQANIDLGAGYPEISNPEWLEKIWRFHSLDAIYQAFTEKYPNISTPENQSLPRFADLEYTLISECFKLLRIDEATDCAATVTNSGSIALNRIFATTISTGSSVLISSPCIDIIPAMVRERNPKEINYVGDNNIFDTCVESIVKSIEKYKPSVLVLTSPNNPTGVFYSSDELHIITSACELYSTTLIVDHCFASINIGEDRIPILTDIIGDSKIAWAIVWDTGKYLDLDNEKFSLVVTSRNLWDKFRDCLAITHYAIPKRQLIQFSLVIGQLCTDDTYHKYFSDIIKENINQLTRILPNIAETMPPTAGSLALIDVGSFGSSSTTLTTKLLDAHEVGVINADVFFHSAEQGIFLDKYVRVALARDPTTFVSGISLLHDSLIEK